MSYGLGLGLTLGGRISGGAPPPTFVGILDTLSAAANFAYSVRRLTANYTGPLLRVRRSSDNAEANIPYDSVGDLDTGVLLAFVGSGSGYVVSWFDQSDNGTDALQYVAALQPRVVNSGTLESANMRASIRYINADQTGFEVTTVDEPPANTVLSVYSPINRAENYETIIRSALSRIHTNLGASPSWGGYATANSPTGVTLNFGQMYTLAIAGDYPPNPNPTNIDTSAQAYTDGVAISISNGGYYNAGPTANIGHETYQGLARGLEGYMPEIIRLYGKVDATECIAAQANQRAYYNI